MMISRPNFLMTGAAARAAWSHPAATTGTADLASLTIKKAAELLRSRYEQATDWHRRRPSLESAPQTKP